MTPEERQKRMEERMAAMSPEERAAFQERMKQRQAQGGGPGGFGGGRGGQGGGQGTGNSGDQPRMGAGGGRGQGAGSGSGNAQRNPSAGSAGGQKRPQAANSKSAGATNATTIDALFAPLPVIETRGRAWLYINKQLKPVSLRLGISDGTFTEVLNDSELPADTDVVTSIITPEMAARPANANNANGNPLMPAQRGRGPGQGGPGGGAGGGGRGGGR
jgi:hypothetical protein